MGDGGTQTPARTTVPQIQLVLYRHLITSGYADHSPPISFVGSCCTPTGAGAAHQIGGQHPGHFACEEP